MRRNRRISEGSVARFLSIDDLDGPGLCGNAGRAFVGRELLAIRHGERVARVVTWIPHLPEAPVAPIPTQVAPAGEETLLAKSAKDPQL